MMLIDVPMKSPTLRAPAQRSIASGQRRKRSRITRSAGTASVIAGSIGLLASLSVAAADHRAGYGYEPTQSGPIGQKEYSPYLDIGYPQRVFWGDTHVHTAYSTDAGMLGNRLGPDEASALRAARRWSRAVVSAPASIRRRTR
jgi:hypothetical protein